MHASELLAPTLREIPAEAEVVSHRLLLRGGFIRRAAAGIYTYLPLGLRVIRKIERIIREEMEQAGGQEILLPILQPAELWFETGRWDVYGPEMFRLEDRHQHKFCLGPTHEEIITALARLEIKSYRQLPLLLYQIQNKYRDERRPRFGLLRGREFIMKDMYSFDQDQAGLESTYARVYEAYGRVFERCGLKFQAVEADPGAIGGNVTHEFMAFAAAGEAEVVLCPHCSYAANTEIAAANPDFSKEEESLKPRELVFTPDVKTVPEVAEFLGLPPSRFLKTLFYKGERGLFCILVRGDRELSEAKLRRFLGCSFLELAPPEEVARSVGMEVGFVGPVGLKGVKIYADYEVKGMVNSVTGAGRRDYHYRNVNLGRDFTVNAFVDLRRVGAGEACPRCGFPLEGPRGIEVGQVFQLGTKYSAAMNANFTGPEGKEHPFYMGCYGIGVSRTLAAIVEQHHDAAGIIWPLAVAPFQAVVIPVSEREEKQKQAAEKLYRELQRAGVEVLLDDRSERAGVKFNDADLIGYPFRLTIGRKTVAEGTVDVKGRASGREVSLAWEEVVTKKFFELV